MNKLFTVFLILLVILGFGSFGMMIYLDERYVAPSSYNIENAVSSLQFSDQFYRQRSLSEIIPQNTNVKLHGWLPTWAMNPGLRTLELKKDQFGSISPVYYELQETGVVNQNRLKLDELKSILSGSNVKLIPTISSFSPVGMDKVLGTDEARKIYNEFLISEVDKYGYDGLDLNYESIYFKNRDNFFSHVSYLSTELKKRSKTFSVTVLSKWGDFITYGFAPETRRVQDYAEIAKYADQIRIMTYDFTSQGSASAGPIAPISWMEDVVKYAVAKAGKEKIILGVHLYGYFWTNGETRARALDYRQIADIIKNNSSQDDFFSDKNAEGALKYVSNGKTFFGYYSSPETVKARIDLASKYGLKGVSFWRLGDDPL